jgi:hypothetical protein
MGSLATSDMWLAVETCEGDLLKCSDARLREHWTGMQMTVNVKDQGHRH